MFQTQLCTEATTYFTLDKIFSKLPSFCETAGVESWRKKGQQKWGNIETSEQNYCPRKWTMSVFSKKISKLKTDSHYVVRMTIGGLHYTLPRNELLHKPHFILCKFLHCGPQYQNGSSRFFWINNESMISLILCGWTFKACHSYCKPIIKLKIFKDQQCVVQCAWVRVTFIVVVSWNESRQTQRYAAEQRFD